MASCTDDQYEQVDNLVNSIVEDDGSGAVYILLANGWDPGSPIYSPTITALLSPWEIALRSHRYNVVESFLHVEKTIFKRHWTQMLIPKREGTDPIMGWTLLHLACLCNFLPAVRLFLENGASVNLQPDNIPHLFDLIYLGPRQGIAFLRELLEHGANVNEAQLLHKLVAFGDVMGLELALSYGANVNLRDERGWTPLLKAAERADRFPEMSRLVLQHGADANAAAPSDGRCAIHIIASQLKLNLELVDWLVQSGANINATNHVGETALHVVSHLHRKGPAKDRVEPFVRALAEHIDLEATDLHGKTALHKACESGNVSVVEPLLALGANPRALDERGWTPWHYACLVNPKLVQEACEIMQDLVAHGADPLARIPLTNRSGLHQLILHVSQYRDVWFCLPVVHLILAQIGNDAPQMNDGDSLTALHYATLVGSPQLCLALLHAGLNVNARGRTGGTPLHYISGIQLDLSGATDSLSAVVKALTESAEWSEPVADIATNVLTVQRHAEDKYALTGFRSTTSDTAYILLSHPEINACTMDANGNLPFFVACANNARLDLIFLMVQNAAMQGLFG